MSALGHEQTSRHVRVMSAIPLKADIHKRGLHVRLVPEADIETLVAFCSDSTAEFGMSELDACDKDFRCYHSWRRPSAKEELYMGILDELLGGGQTQKHYRDFVNRYEQGDPSEGYSDQEVLEPLINTLKRRRRRWPRCRRKSGRRS